MNRKQQRRERKIKNKENYLRNRRNWCLNGGPLVVMDDPSEEHVKALLLGWISLRKVLEQVSKDLSLMQRGRVDKSVLEAMTGGMGLMFDPEMRETIDELWCRMMRHATQGARVDPPAPITKLYTA